MASSNRFEYSHETHTIRYDQGVSLQTLCNDLLDSYEKTKNLNVPVLINIPNQSWRPSKLKISSWASGFAYLTNTSFINIYEENSLAILNLYGWMTVSFTNHPIYSEKAIIWCGNKSDFSDASIEWAV